jgi:hypothetical protein
MANNDSQMSTTPGAVAREELLSYGWASEHYGVVVVDLSDPDDGYRGGFLALGHHQDTRRVVAAWNAFARSVCGWESMLDTPAEWDDYTEIRDEVGQRWAVLAPAADDEIGCSDYLLARFDFRGGTLTAATPGAFPVTVWGWD